MDAKICNCQNTRVESLLKSLVVLFAMFGISNLFLGFNDLWNAGNEVTENILILISFGLMIPMAFLVK